MKKVWLTLFLVLALLVVTAGMAAAEELSPNDPVSSEDDGGAVEGEKPDEEKPAVDEQPVKEEPAPDEDYVRPDEEGEIGITAIGIELEEGADVVATAYDNQRTASGFSWAYGAAGAVVILLAAALVSRRKARA
jgi:hypothetical protein